MTPEAWIGAAALTLNVLVLAIGYGVLKGTVAGIEARVKALESEMTAISSLKADVARIDERTKAMKDGQDRLLNSWLVQDPPVYEPQPPAGVTGPRRKR